jgi:hypothetical protein
MSPELVHRNLRNLDVPGTFRLMYDFALWQCLLKFSKTFIRDICGKQVQFLEFDQFS